MPDTQAPTLAPRLLPPNRTPLESAVVRALHATDHPERTLATLYQARGERAVAAPLLPWLAWSVDVLAWPRQAHETQQRNLAARSWHLHRQQGTLAGFKALAEVFGGQITRAITPPAKVYAAPALTRAERETFVARYPQLRIYRHRTVGQRQGAMLARCHLGAAWLLASDAVLRLMPRAALWRAGVETPLSVAERVTTTGQRVARTVTEVAAPGQAGALAFVARHPRYPARSTAAARLYRVVLAQSYADPTERVLRRELLRPDLAPIDVRPDDVAEPGTAQGVLLDAAPVARRHLVASTARDRLYQRLYLFDPEVQITHRRASLYAGAGRLGMPAHHAELRLRLEGQAHPQAVRRHVHGHLVTRDHTVLQDCLASLRDIARASDRIAIDTTTRAPATAGGAALAGALLAGAWTDH